MLTKDSSTDMFKQFSKGKKNEAELKSCKTLNTFSAPALMDLIRTLECLALRGDEVLLCVGSKCSIVKETGIEEKGKRQREEEKEEGMRGPIHMCYFHYILRNQRL